MDFGRLGRGDIVAAAGGLLLFISMWLPWFSRRRPARRRARTCAAPARSRARAFETFSLFSALIIPGMDFLLVGAALAPWILVWIVVRGHTLSWPPGEVTMIVGAIAIDPDPLQRRSSTASGATREFVSLDIGWYLGLLGALHDRGRRRDQPDHARRRHAQASRHVLALLP